MPRIRSFEFVLDLLFPKICQGCDLEGAYFCPICQKKAKSPLDKCFVCGLPSLLSRTHKGCHTKELVLDGLLVVSEYENLGIRNLIWNLKYNYISEIAAVLGMLLSDHFFANNLYDYFYNSPVVPVPLHKRRLRARGFNQAGLLALDFAERQNRQFLETLKRVKNSESQVDLPREKRFENVKGLFQTESNQGIAGKKILLVDDVATTGATLNECAKALKSAGAPEVWGLVVARN